MEILEIFLLFHPLYQVFKNNKSLRNNSTKARMVINININIHCIWYYKIFCQNCLPLCNVFWYEINMYEITKKMEKQNKKENHTWTIWWSTPKKNIPWVAKTIYLYYFVFCISHMMTKSTPNVTWQCDVSIFLMVLLCLLLKCLLW